MKSETFWNVLRVVILVAVIAVVLITGYWLLSVLGILAFWKKKPDTGGTGKVDPPAKVDDDADKKAGGVASQSGLIGVARKIVAFLSGGKS